MTTTIPTTGPIKIELVRTNFFTRWPCHVCGGCTEKVAVLAEGPEGLRVCESCLQAGDIDARLEAQAAALDAGARMTRSLIGRLQVPSFAEWSEAENAAEVEDAAALEAADRAEAARRAKLAAEPKSEPTFTDVSSPLTISELAVLLGMSEGALLSGGWDFDVADAARMLVDARIDLSDRNAAAAELTLLRKSAPAGFVDAALAFARCMTVNDVIPF